MCIRGLSRVVTSFIDAARLPATVIQAASRPIHLGSVRLSPPTLVASQLFPLHESGGGRPRLIPLSPELLLAMNPMIRLIEIWWDDFQWVGLTRFEVFQKRLGGRDGRYRSVSEVPPGVSINRRGSKFPAHADRGTHLLTHCHLDALVRRQRVGAGDFFGGREIYHT